MKKYQITLNESQLHSIVEALDQYARLSCMQFNEAMLWTRIEEVQHKYRKAISPEQMEMLKEEIEAIKAKYIGGYGASWNASEFVKELFYIRGSLTPILCKELKKQNPHHSCCRCDGVEWMGTDYEKIDIQEVLNDKK